MSRFAQTRIGVLNLALLSVSSRVINLSASRAWPLRPEFIGEVPRRRFYFPALIRSSRVQLIDLV